MLQARNLQRQCFASIPRSFLKTANDGWCCGQACGFETITPPTVTDLGKATDDPAVLSRATDSGDTIVLKGARFAASGNGVTVGASPCNVTLESSIEIQCTVATNAVGGYHGVQVSVPGVGFATMDAPGGGYLHISAAISSGGVAPSSGSLAGGQEIEITGSGFADSSAHADYENIPFGDAGFTVASSTNTLIQASTRPRDGQSKWAAAHLTDRSHDVQQQFTNHEVHILHMSATNLPYETPLGFPQCAASSAGADAHKACDGDLSTVWVGSGHDQWLMLDLGSPTFVSSYRLWSDDYVGTVKRVTVSGSMTPSFEDPTILDEPQASTYAGNFNATQTFLVSHPAVARYVMFDFSDYTSTERVSEVMVNPEGILSPGVVAEYPVPTPAAHADGDVRLSEGSYGRLEMFQVPAGSDPADGEWGTVCHTAAWQKDHRAMLALATVVCRQLGFDPEASDYLDGDEMIPFRGIGSHGRPVYSVSPVSQICHGDEATLAECTQQGRDGDATTSLTQGGASSCTHNHDVGVVLKATISKGSGTSGSVQNK